MDYSSAEQKARVLADFPWQSVPGRTAESTAVYSTGMTLSMSQNTELFTVTTSPGQHGSSHLPNTHTWNLPITSHHTTSFIKPCCHFQCLQDVIPLLRHQNSPPRRVSMHENSYTRKHTHTLTLSCFNRVSFPLSDQPWRSEPLRWPRWRRRWWKFSCCIDWGFCSHFHL